MSSETLAGIPSKAVPRTVRLKDPTLRGPESIRWIFAGYCERLIHKNGSLQEWLGRFISRFDDPQCRAGLTQGQRILYSLGALDGQVENGGITQFFWNCPDLLVEASESLNLLGESELGQAYDKAFNSLIGKKEEWIDLRAQACRESHIYWEPFQKSYELLNLEGFDDAYYQTYGPALIARLVDYVKSHTEQFIKPAV